MSFIHNDEREEESAESEKKNPDNQNEEKKSGLSGIRSAILLVAILVGLFYAKPYLTGEKEIAEIPNLSIAGEKAESAPKPELIIPRVMDKEMKKLLGEFKAQYEKIVPAEEIVTTEPSVRAAKFSKDRKKLLFELECLVPSKNEGEPKIADSQDLIFSEDEFGRLVTIGRFEGIKLYPAEK